MYLFIMNKSFSLHIFPPFVSFCIVCFISSSYHDSLGALATRRAREAFNMKSRRIRFIFMFLTRYRSVNDRACLPLTGNSMSIIGTLCMDFFGRAFLSDLAPQINKIKAIKMREREIEREGERQTDRQRQRETEKDRDRDRQRHIETETDRQTDRDTERGRDRHRETEKEKGRQK